MNQKSERVIFNVGDKLMLKKDINVNQIVDDTTKNWDDWEKMDYVWIDVKDLIKGETYTNPNTGEELTFHKYNITENNKFAVDINGVIHIAQKFRKKL